MSVKILVIDDEEALCEILKFNLEKDGYLVDCAYSAEEALKLDLNIYNLFIVDIMMDNISGFDFVKRIRDVAETESKPVIFCSALGDEDDKVMGLNIGADDYITKPFVISEVLARVRAVLRRADARKKIENNAANSNLAEDLSNFLPNVTFRGLVIDRNDKTCSLDGKTIDLTRTEYDLLLFFLTHSNRVYSREEIIKYVWPNDVYVSHRTIDTNITRLRKKLGEYSANIITRQGFGYGFKETI